MDRYAWCPIPVGLYRCFSRNPLVRASDRLEAIVKLIAAILAVLAIAPAAAFGTAVHDQQVQLALRQVAEWHNVPAQAVANSVIQSRVAADAFRSNVRWMVSGRTYTGSIEGPTDLKTGDWTTVWVDKRGDITEPPMTREQIATAAFGAAAALWLGVVGGLLSLVGILHRRLDRSRYAGWSNEWRMLDHDGGGRKDWFR
ncbi:hypothetical protein M2432_004643 [Mycobacterium sp. OTB74]|jgi:hypothetical protein|nr:hypothetical protein [Mycobacterium sp. OTB74]